MYKIIVISLCVFLFCCLLFSYKQNTKDKFSINWDNLIELDAEDLAEHGIKQIYEEHVIPHLKNYVAIPIEIEELSPIDNSEYKVKANDKVYFIYDDDNSKPVYLSWRYATFALFDIVNQQLKNSNYRFYAFYNGNDLSGMFMTKDEYQQYCHELKVNKACIYYIPYIPTPEPDRFGQPINMK